jgi:hypothetical protein
MFTVYFDRATKSMEIASYDAHKLMNAESDLGVTGIDFVSLGGCGPSRQQQKKSKTSFHA